MIDGLRTFVSQISILSDGALSRLTDCFHKASLSKNEYFAKEGEYASRIAFLSKGIVRAYFLNREGKEYNKQFFVGPTLIGAYSSLLSKRPNKIAQQALTDCELVVADYADIESLYTHHHEIERLGRKIAESYFLEKEKKEIEMALLDAEKRYLILRETFPTIEMQISKYHIASYLGISPTQLSRVRRKMKVI